MRVLHLFSNYKWTGPADPALSLCCELRAAGVDTDFACAPDSGKFFNMVVASARARGVEPVLDFHLRKHRHPWRNPQDVRALRRFLAAHPYDLVHCHLDNDHEIAARALQGSSTPLVRSSYEGAGLGGRRRHHRMLARTTVLLEPSEIARQNDIETFRLAEDKVVVVPGAVDTERFAPSRNLPDARAKLGIPHDAYLVGIVARMQTHRHFEDLLEAMRALIGRVPRARLLIVGRGTNQETVARRPARALGIEEHVHFTGYIEEDEYVAALGAMDVGVYLVPGSDGTCRAARELLAMGRPLVVADRGMLREIVIDGESGTVTDGSPPALEAALAELALDPERRARYAQNARHLAETRYAPAAQAAQVKAIYTQLLTPSGTAAP